MPDVSLRRAVVKSDQKGIIERVIWKFDGESASPATDRIAREEPLELRVAGETLMVTMRTPGADRALAMGFLFAEGLISGAADLGRLVHCGRPGDEGFGNVLDAHPAPGFALNVDDLRLARRGTLTTAACGVCGRQSIEDLHARIPTLAVSRTMGAQELLSAVSSLGDSQPIFRHTGGIHGAALVTEAGELSFVAEDIGRHNAVDKVVGMALFAAEERANPPSALIVSGRLSYEIAQKAAAFGVPVVAGVSAPSSLAIELAERFGLTLCGFVRGDKMNVYTHPERLFG